MWQQEGKIQRSGSSLTTWRRNNQDNWTHQHQSQACFLCQSMASHTVTAWPLTLVTNLSSLHLTYDCLHNRVHKQNWLAPSLVTNCVFSPQPISTHNTHTMWIGWNAVTAATDSSLASLLVADSPSHNTSTQTTVFIASTHRLPPATDDSLQSFYKHTTHISYHSGETLRSVRHPRFQPPPARHVRATVLASPRQPIDDSTISRSSSTFQAIDDSTLSRYRGPSSIHVPSNRRQQTILVFQAIDESTKSSPSNRREQKVFVFQAIDDSRQSSSSKQSTRAQSLLQAIDDSTKSSSSKQSTTAQSLRLPSNRRAFLHQHTQRRAATYERKTTGREHSWPCTHHVPTTPTSSARARSCVHIARTHAPHTHHTNTNYKKTVCQCHERIHCLCSMETNKKKEKEKRNTHSPYKHKLHKTRKRTSVTSELKKKKYLVCMQVQCLSLKIKKEKKEKKKV